jgi:O-antigen ligase
MTPAAQIPEPPPSTPGLESPLDQAIAIARRHWRTAVFALLGVQLLLVVFDRLHLPFGIEFGSRSFARNVAVFTVLGMFAGARGLPRVRSQVLLPLVLFLAAAALSVAFAGTKWGDFNSLLAMVGLFIGARSIADDADGRRWLFHWLGVLTATTVVLEIVQNPSILQLREELRGTTVTAHPNTLGVFFALLGPLFIARTFDAEDRAGALFYTACALLGASFTFSRLAWSALLLGTLVIVLAGRPLRRRAVLASGVLAAGLVGAAIAYLSLGRSEADWQRLRIIYTSLTLFQEHWLVGIGFGTGNLARLFPARYIELYGSSLFLFHSHNMYVDVLVGTGVLGAAAMAFVLWRLAGVARQCLEAARRQPTLRLQATGFAASVLVFLYVGVGDMPWYHSKILLPLAIVWGLMEGWSSWAEASDRLRVQGRESALPVRSAIG